MPQAENELPSPACDKSSPGTRSVVLVAALLRIPGHARRASLPDCLKRPGGQLLLRLGRRIALNAFVALQPVTGPAEACGVLLEDALAVDPDLSLGTARLRRAGNRHAVVGLGHRLGPGRAALRSFVHR